MEAPQSIHTQSPSAIASFSPAVDLEAREVVVVPKLERARCGDRIVVIAHVLQLSRLRRRYFGRLGCRRRRRRLTLRLDISRLVRARGRGERRAR